MRRVDFVEVLKKLGASPEGIEAVSRVPGKVTQVARKFAHPRGRGAPVKRQYFDWLVEQVATINTALTPFEQSEVTQIVTNADTVRQ